MWNDAPGRCHCSAAQHGGDVDACLGGVADVAGGEAQTGAVFLPAARPEKELEVVSGCLEMCIRDSVERALFYARAESPEKDLVIRETSLEELADQALQSHRALLIQSGVRVETRDLDQRVYTDGKWVCFLLGQLLQNAAR